MLYFVTVGEQRLLQTTWFTPSVKHQNLQEPVTRPRSPRGVIGSTGEESKIENWSQTKVEKSPPAAPRAGSERRKFQENPERRRKTQSHATSKG